MLPRGEVGKVISDNPRFFFLQPPPKVIRRATVLFYGHLPCRRVLCFQLMASLLRHLKQLTQDLSLPSSLSISSSQLDFHIHNLLHSPVLLHPCHAPEPGLSHTKYSKQDCVTHGSTIYPSHHPHTYMSFPELLSPTLTFFPLSLFVILKPHTHTHHVTICIP